MKNILCFGDSNTFGEIPEGGRYARNERWTGLLQQKLGDEYYVIEEAMNGRTTVWEDPIQEDRCGIKSLPLCLHCHKPLDLVILFLGTNDVKNYYPVIPEMIGRSMERLIEVTQGFPYGDKYMTAPPKILVVSPTYVGEDVEKGTMPQFDNQAREKSMRLAPIYEAVATKHNCYFLDAAKYADTGADYVHLKKEGHVALAEAFAEKITDIFKD
ncbi:SGNH/GDSL hydrolase family protein [Chakrabartyella piscis]|uniref:SGNH/GDSL hydrolase family protein n=1 Tax=Chakrabartyella piscis TaxID=2918914 RepID=UPI0029583C54|nr:SGNH/GDSL hydrolase family protein [Chakrabartyella piscis]